MPSSLLLIDDSAISRKMLIKKLPPNTYTILEASSGAQGLEVYQENEVDLIFLDLTMPDMDGFETLEKLKQIDSQAKVVVLSADVQISSQERVMQLGALDFLHKPANVDHVHALLDKHLS